MRVLPITPLPIIPVVTLESLVGYVPANFNMLPWALNWKNTDFTNSQFAATRSSVSSGIIAPDKNATAQKLVADTSNNTHFITCTDTPQTATVTPINHRMALIAKADGYARIVIETVSFEDANAKFSIGVDLGGGNIGYDNVIGSNFTLVAATMTAVVSGWWLIEIDFNYNITPVAAANVWEPKIFIDNGSGTAARSTTFAGDGVSGVNLWWFNQLPAGAWSLTKKVFEDDFDSLSTIDLSDTGAAGFKWYVHNLAPNSFMTTFGWKTAPPSNPTPASNLSIVSPSVLQIHNPNNNQTGFTSQIWSVYFPNGGGFVGNAFNAPLVYDSLQSWDPTFNADNPGENAFWGSTIDALQGGTPSTGRFVEWDVNEGLSTSASNTIHEWSNPSSPVDYHSTTGVNSGMVLGVFQRLSGMWLKIDSSGYGIFLAFLNGQSTINSDIAYSATTLPIPTAANAVVGSLSEADSQLMPIFINTTENVTANVHGGGTIQVDWVRIYSTP